MRFTRPSSFSFDMVSSGSCRSGLQSGESGCVLSACGVTQLITNGLILERWLVLRVIGHSLTLPVIPLEELSLATAPVVSVV